MPCSCGGEQSCNIMPALFEECCGLGTDEHGPLVLADQRCGFALLVSSQTLALALQMKSLQSRRHSGGKLGLRRAPEIGIVQCRERCYGSTQFGREIISYRYRSRKYFQELVFNRALGLCGTQSQRLIERFWQIQRYRLRRHASPRCCYHCTTSTSDAKGRCADARPTGFEPATS